MITTTDEFGGRLQQSYTPDISKKDTNGEAYCKLILATERISGNPGQSVGSGEKARQKFEPRVEKLVSPPLLENFRRSFSPDPTNCPWVSEDGRKEITKKQN